MCDLEDLEITAILFFLDRKTLISTTFTLVEIISFCKKKNAVQ